MIGLLIAAYDLAEIVPKPTFGALANRPFTSAVALVRFLQDIGAASLSAVSLALIGINHPETRGTAYGVYNAIKGAAGQAFLLTTYLEFENYVELNAYLVLDLDCSSRDAYRSHPEIVLQQLGRTLIVAVFVGHIHLYRRSSPVQSEISTNGPMLVVFLLNRLGLKGNVREVFDVEDFWTLHGRLHFSSFLN